MEAQFCQTRSITPPASSVATLKDPRQAESMESDSEMFPILVRSMAMSGRHRWEASSSATESRRRLSLDTPAMDGDWGREDLQLSSHLHQSAHPECSSKSQGKPNGKNEKEAKINQKKLELGSSSYSGSEVLVSDCPVLVLLETSRSVSRAAGEDPDETLYTKEAQSHMLMAQSVLQELKQYHGAKTRTGSREAKEPSGNVTWYEFLSNENGDEDDHAEKMEGGNAKVKRTLSSLRNRVAGSFTKDKGKNREKEKGREMDSKEDSKEEPKEKHSKEKDPKEKHSKEKDSKEKDPKEKHSKEKDSKEKDPKEKHSKEKDSKEKDPKEKHSKEKDSKEKDPKEKHSKEKDSKEKELSNGHQLVPATVPSGATCTLCNKPPQRRDGLQCHNCSIAVHRGCRSLLTECSSRNRFKEPPTQSSGKVRSRVQYYNLALKESAVAGGSPPGMTVAPRGQSRRPAAACSPDLAHGNSSGSIPGEMEESDAVKLKPLMDDSVAQLSSSAEAIVLEDAHCLSVQADLEFDAQDFELESWSLAVDPQYVKNHSKEAAKRQDVIYELIQTEIHHVRTLKIMLWVYAHKMREMLQVERIFPRLEHLLEVHRNFLSRLKDRRRESLEPGSERNYSIQRIGDIITSQFSGTMGERLKDNYSGFCCRHTEAVSYYKDQLQNNKKFQNLIRKISNLPIVKRQGVQECILLVTQRITKYPVLMERLLQNTAAGTEEHRELTEALALIRATITQVDAHVNDYEKATRLREITSKIEPKSVGKVKDGRVLSREDLGRGGRKLLHEGTVTWKAASGRLKDTLAVLLTDVLLLLQEKDQKYTFSTVDNKPSVISLQKLIVREVAHEERGMFLICASSNEPEMYEIHAASKEERNLWMGTIRQAVENCPHVGENSFVEQEDERLSRLKEFQERLSLKDAQITQSLNGKLQIFADLAEFSAGVGQTASRAHLLLRGDSSDLQQGENLLKDAITEVESLQVLLLSGRREASLESEHSQSPGGLPCRAETSGSYDSLPTSLSKTGSMRKPAAGRESRSRERSQRARSDPQLRETGDSQQSGVVGPLGNGNTRCSNSFPETEFLDRVLMLSQRLYSLQQDGQVGQQRASLANREQSGRPRGGTPLEQEKQREELADLRRLRSQHQQEQARWQRERQREQCEAEEGAAQLRHREEACRALEERLAEEHHELELHRDKYRQDLERLRESSAAVEKEREWLERQRSQRAGLVLPPESFLSFNGISGTVSDPVSDYPERPETLLRRDSSTSIMGKTEVPIHLISTTNQQLQQRGVSQQIPTKLAALSKGKEKTGKGKGSQRTDSMASADTKQTPSVKQSAKEEGGPKAKGPVTPPQPHQTDPASILDLDVDSLPPGPPPQQLAGHAPKEDVIFF
ncbi:rho guanine nucleotide exchange factor 18-like isoform X2 [Brienomyrus brachyistius]|uniref:rho guanine nucleotide exchange factor 18-like isoform X2 n=1 Tax=Brienomyrus brachyistius TaxID=42636 RepID=UPI0020B2E7EF|nr:rho guanine nucleotide exchange factor 18-like isoform X2 [Brienomyrus brachyistius]